MLVVSIMKCKLLLEIIQHLGIQRKVYKTYIFVGQSSHTLCIYGKAICHFKNILRTSFLTLESLIEVLHQLNFVNVFDYLYIASLVEWQSYSASSQV